MWTLAYLLLLSLTPACAQTDSSATVQQRLDELDQRQKVLERRWEQQDERALKLKAGVLLQVDGRFFPERLPGGAADQFLMRRARLILEGSVTPALDFRFMPDFGGGQASVQDAYLDVIVRRELKLRAGKSKVPLGLEALQPDSKGLFIERGLPSGLMPNRDIGFQAHGDAAEGRVQYALGVFNWAADGASADGDSDNAKDVAGRLFFFPLKGTEVKALEGLGFGAGASVGRQEGTAAATGLAAAYRTPAQQTFFSYLAGTLADGRRRRLVPQGHWYWGRFGFLAEHSQTWQYVRRAAASPATAELRHRSWQAAASWVLTGEDASFAGVKPRRPFSLEKRDFGAFELSGRYGELWLDHETFPRFADPARSRRGLHTWTAGLIWAPTTAARVMVDYEHSRLAGGGRDREQAVLSRVQLAF